MKKIFFTVVILLTALITSGCSMVLQGQQYDYGYGYEEEYNEDYAYLDDYSLINWSVSNYDILYSYYDSDRVFLIILGNRIYIIPYDYFYHYIIPRFRGRIIWRSYDWFCNWWGYSYYNSLWSHWHYRHHRSYWRRGFNYYYHHRITNPNQRPFIINKNNQKPIDGIRQPLQPRPRYDTPKVIPRDKRYFEPRKDYPRSYRTPSKDTNATRRTTNTPRYSNPPPQTTKNDKDDRKG